jgi:hypothetical protein
MIAPLAVALCGPRGPVILLRERRLAKLRQELVEAIQWDRLRRCDLDTQWFARCGVIDYQQPIMRCYGPRALPAGLMRQR